jgi:peptide/nickel transport system permease protein
MSMLGGNYTEELYYQTRQALGLDRPFIVQFADYVWGIITRFDFGTSFIFGHSVGAEISNRIGLTLTLGLLGVSFGVLLGIPFGLISATKQYSIFDYGVTTIAVFFAAMPNFWMALMLILVFALNLRLVPISGIGTWRHWILPIFTQATTGLAVLTRMTRSSMLEVIRQDYIRTARAKGAERIHRHL